MTRDEQIAIGEADGDGEDVQSDGQGPNEGED